MEKPVEELTATPLTYAVQAYHLARTMYTSRYDRLRYAAKWTAKKFGLSERQVYLYLSDYLR
jgi:hypothetical protein